MSDVHDRPNPAEHKPRARERTFVVEDQRMRAVATLAERAGRSDAKVLITGESGSGKDLVAHHVHVHSKRRTHKFVAVNCGGLAESLLESELFGHVKGSFTGAHRDKPGKVQMAHRGTLFLDEVGEMSLRMQALLLRFLESGEVHAVGSDAIADHVDVRIIAATNRDPLLCVKKGDLREDLYYRLAVIHVDLPPLRQRTEDIPLLVQHFVAQFNERVGKRIRGLEPRALEALMKYPWPGNIRELRNLIEGTFALAKGTEIGVADLPRKIAPGAGGAAGAEAAAGAEGPIPPLEETLREIEKRLILRALRVAEGNKSRAADLLKVSRKRIYRKLEEYGIPLDDEDFSTAD